MNIKTDTQIIFSAIGDKNTLRVVIPKADYTLVADDEDYYYLAPTVHLGSLMQAAE